MVLSRFFISINSKANECCLNNTFQGLDLVTLARDHELLSWLGANSYRTSHYPYAEEDLMMADREGLLVIAECAAVSLDGFSSELLGGHWPLGLFVQIKNLSSR